MSEALAKNMAEAQPGRLYELWADAADIAAAAAAALHLAAVVPANRPLVWLRPLSAERRSGGLYGPGLAALGLDPGRLLLAVLPDDLALLKAAADVLRAGSAGALLLELHGAARRLDLTASRRLALAAASGGTLALLLRVGAQAVPSAAWRRWSASSAPSRPLAAKAPGPPAVALTLTRNRNGPAGAATRLDWHQGRWAEQAQTRTGAEQAAPQSTPRRHDHEPHSPQQHPALARGPLSLPPGRPLPSQRHAA